MVRKLARVMAMVTLVAPAALVATELPAAAVPVQSCAHVSGTATFSPGLSSTPRDNTVRAKGTETSCTPSATTGGSGSITATIVVKQGSCAKLGAGNQTLNGQGRTVWKNTKSSFYKFTIHTGTGSNITLATLSGGVTSGLFAGKHFQGQIRFKVVTGDCAATPVTKVSFTNTKPFTIG
jgi:hypothetical protein